MNRSSIRGSVANTGARQLLRALRGDEVQEAFSTRLGYRSNVAAEWEGGRRFPNALELLRICSACDIDALTVLRSLSPPHGALVQPDDLGPWFDALRGTRTQQALAADADRSRHQIRRWLTGTAVPRIPDLLILIDALVGRSATFAASLVGDAGVPVLRGRLRAERARARQQRQVRISTLENTVQQALATVGVDNIAVHTVPVGPRGMRQLIELAEDGIQSVPDEADPATLAVWVVGSTRAEPSKDPDD